MAFPGRDEIGTPELLARSRAYAAALAAHTAARARRRRLKEAADSLGLHDVGDLLEHVPRARREARDGRRAGPGGDRDGARRGSGRSPARSVRRRGRARWSRPTVADATGPMRATFFNQPWLAPSATAPGRDWCSTGPTRAANRFRVATHAITDEAVAGRRRGLSLRGDQGAPSTQILALVSAERAAVEDVVDPLPGRLVARAGVAARGAALAAMHFGEGGASETGRRRLAFEELLFVQLALLARRARADAGVRAVALDGGEELTRRWPRGWTSVRPDRGSGCGDRRAAD